MYKYIGKTKVAHCTGRILANATHYSTSVPVTSDPCVVQGGREDQAADSAAETEGGGEGGGD